MGGKKLSKDRLAKLAYRFVVWGSFLRTEYGGASPLMLSVEQHNRLVNDRGVETKEK